MRRRRFIHAGQRGTCLDWDRFFRSAGRALELQLVYQKQKMFPPTLGTYKIVSGYRDHPLLRLLSLCRAHRKRLRVFGQGGAQGPVTFVISAEIKAADITDIPGERMFSANRTVSHGIFLLLPQKTQTRNVFAQNLFYQYRSMNVRCVYFTKSRPVCQFYVGGYVRAKRIMSTKRMLY